MSNNLWLIIKREYLTRVTRRTFILSTLLTPIAMVAFFVLIGFIFSYEGSNEKHILIVDEAKIFENSAIKDENGLFFKFSKDNLETTKSNLDEKYEGILHLPPMKTDVKEQTIYYYSDKDLSLMSSEVINKAIVSKVRDFKINAFNLDKAQLEKLKTKITIDPEPLTGTDDKSSSAAAIGSMLGGGMGMVMYFAVFIYGMMVMKSVQEEKTNRIVEVMISSVRPFELMMGKIIGVGGVGLTQLAIWMILMPTLLFITSLFVSIGGDPEQMQQSGAAADIDPETLEAMVTQVVNDLSAMNWWLIIPLFIFYFLGGYFLYASLFAAVGSAAGEEASENNALTMPITIPVILALYIMIVVVQTPDSSLATWSSIFPLFSPIVMPARLAFNPPIWEVILSMVVLLATTVFFVWLSGRIYRIGILMYGKKVGFKELWKWLFFKG